MRKQFERSLKKAGFTIKTGFKVGGRWPLFGGRRGAEERLDCVGYHQSTFLVMGLADALRHSCTCRQARARSSFPSRDTRTRPHARCAQVLSAEPGPDGVKVTIEPAKGGDAVTLDANIVLVATGRRPFTKGLDLDKAGVELDERGRIKVDDKFTTTNDSVKAIGDCIPGPMLAHKVCVLGFGRGEGVGEGAG